MPGVRSVRVSQLAGDSERLFRGCSQPELVVLWPARSETERSPGQRKDQERRAHKGVGKHTPDGSAVGRWLRNGWPWRKGARHPLLLLIGSDPTIDQELRPPRRRAHEREEQMLRGDFRARLK